MPVRASLTRGPSGTSAGRGGAAVFLSRFMAFFRAVVPALAGAARLPYRRFRGFNAAAGTWGSGFVLLGFLAVNSYEAVARAAGRDIAVVVFVLAIIGVITWRVRKAAWTERRRRGLPPSSYSAFLTHSQ
jgi:membrane-associated protein